MKRYYFDHNSTSPLLPQVRENLYDLSGIYGNHSSIHFEGRKIKKEVRRVRELFAHKVHTTSSSLIFTSGGTESNISILREFYLSNFKNPNFKNHIIASSVEHPSVEKTLSYLETLGLRVTRVEVSREGEISLSSYQTALKQGADLAVCMYVNNETGGVFPIKEMCELAHEYGCLFFSDCVQALGKKTVDLKDLNIDMASFSAHKYNSLKGCGITYIKPGIEYTVSIAGGGQERGRRPGTENTLAILSLGVALEQDTWSQINQKIRNCRDHFEQRILSEVKDVKITCADQPRTINTSHLFIDKADGESLLLSLDLAGFAVSTGAACSSGRSEPSATLLAMGFTRREAQSSLRVSFGYGNELNDVDLLVDELILIIHRLRQSY